MDVLLSMELDYVAIAQVANVVVGEPTTSKEDVLETRCKKKLRRIRIADGNTLA